MNIRISKESLITIGVVVGIFAAIVIGGIGEQVIGRYTITYTDQ